MAYTAANLHLNPVAPGSNSYVYRTSDDSMATVATAGYFDDGPNAAPKLEVGDLVWCQCTDGNMWLKVSARNSTTGAATMQFAGGNLPVQTWATGTAAGDFYMSPGYYEVGSDIATGSRAVLPTPYPGAEVMVLKTDSGTSVFHFDAGASGTGTAIPEDNRGGTGVTYDGTNRRIRLTQEGESFHVVGTSTSRWRIQNLHHQASAAGEGASAVLLGT